MAAFNSLSPRDSAFVRDQGFDTNGDGVTSAAEFGNFHATTMGLAEGRTGFNLPQAGQPQATSPNVNPVGTPVVGAQPGVGQSPNVNPAGTPVVGGQPQPQAGVGGPQPLFDPSLPGAGAINNSIFAAQAQTGFNRERDAIDSNLASQGLAFSGARLQAVEDAQQRAGRQAVGDFFNVLGNAPTAGPATLATTQLGSNFATNTGNALGAQGAANQNAAFQTGQARSDLFGNLATAGGQAIGAFNIGGGQRQSVPLGFA